MPFFLPCLRSSRTVARHETTRHGTSTSTTRDETRRTEQGTAHVSRNTTRRGTQRARNKTGAVRGTAVQPRAIWCKAGVVQGCCEGLRPKTKVLLVLVREAEGIGVDKDTDIYMDMVHTAKFVTLLSRTGTAILLYCFPRCPWHGRLRKGTCMLNGHTTQAAPLDKNNQRIYALIPT